MAAKKVAKKKETEVDQMKTEMASIEGAIDSLRQHGFEMESDLREARMMLFITLAILFAMFGLALGLAIKIFF